MLLLILAIAYISLMTWIHLSSSYLDCDGKPMSKKEWLHHRRMDSLYH